MQLLDPQLYAHLETHECLSLFCCFRWLLLRFKREFKMEQVLRLWVSAKATPHARTHRRLSHPVWYPSRQRDTSVESRG